MNDNFDLQNYLIEGVEGVVKEAIKATLKKSEGKRLYAEVC